MRIKINGLKSKHRKRWLGKLKSLVGREGDWKVSWK